MYRSDRVQPLLDTLAEIRDRCWGQPSHDKGLCCLAAEDADEAIKDFDRGKVVDAIGSGR